MAELTLERAMKIANNAAGPEGLSRLISEINQVVENLRNEKASLSKRVYQTEGQIQAWLKIGAMLTGARLKWGLEGVTHLQTFNSEKMTPEEKVVDDFPELEEQKSKGLCLYCDRKTKKWCQRKLTGKVAKKTGYCKSHRVRLGLES